MKEEVDSERRRRGGETPGRFIVSRVPSVRVSSVSRRNEGPWTRRGEGRRRPGREGQKTLDLKRASRGTVQTPRHNPRTNQVNQVQDYSRYSGTRLHR